MEKERLPRPCNECGTRFQPTGKFSRLCNKCKKESSERRERNKRK